MIDFLDRIYNVFTKRNKIQSLCRFIVRKIANGVLPLYFTVFKVKSTIRKESRDFKLIVSLTTFPKRISKVWMVVESMLRQDVVPDLILIWLSNEQFPNRYKDLPDNLKNLLRDGTIEVRFVQDDLRSHKKYYYAMNEYPNDIIITVDDDIFYPSNIVSDLLQLHFENPNTICCLRGYEVIKENGRILPYNKWEKLRHEQGPTFKIFHTSGGGTLYKKSFFTSELFNVEVIKRYCFYADDVWLNIMAQINKTKTVKGSFYTHLLPISSNSERLSSKNVSLGGNDKQLRDLIFHYKLKEDEIFF